MKLPTHSRFDYISIDQRPDYSWPGGKRLAALQPGAMLPLASARSKIFAGAAARSWQMRRSGLFGQADRG